MNPDGPLLKARVGIALAAILITLVVCALPVCSQERETRQIIAEFSQGRLDQWAPKVFDGESQYRLVQVAGRTALQATAKDSASGLFKKIRVDLTRTPFLNWSWRVDRPHPPLDERSKAGDDYAARVYLVVDGGLLFWKTIALNYVWSSAMPPGSHWPNSFAGENVMLLAVRSSEDALGVWHHEKRNVVEDFKRLFNKEITTIDAVALMTDSDNSGGEATAYYGDIYFSEN